MSRDCGILFQEFIKKLTAVTDRANTMPNVVGASMSANVCSFGEKWGPCAPHLLDTNMKRAFLSGQDEESMI